MWGKYIIYNARVFMLSYEKQHYFVSLTCLKQNKDFMNFIIKSLYINILNNMILLILFRELTLIHL